VAALAERPAASRLATASIVGTTLEYYDFAVYNMLAALVFNRLFFPSFDPLSGTLLAFSTFAVGYLSRPFGGIVFGHLGDRYGRRFVLVATLLLMGVTTGLMGLLPTYATAGIASPIMLVVLRFIQGAALGGEWAGAVLLSVEHGDPQRRGRNASWAQMGPSLGTLMATASIALITWMLSPDDFIEWGWRVPFFASVALVVFGLWIRVGIDETPLFKQIEQQHSKAQAPIMEVVREHWRSLVVGGAVRIGPDVLYSITVAFSLSYMTTVLGLSRTLALTALSLGGVVNAFTIPLFGSLSDRLGRRVVYGAGSLLALAWMFAFFPLLATLQPALIVLAVVIALALHAMMYGPQAAFIAEQFPTRVRYAGASLAYTLAGIVGGGIAPMVSTALLQSFGTTVAISSYAAIASLITCVVLLSVRERAREQLN
jgi:metabolite-proton symporter